MNGEPRVEGTVPAEWFLELKAENQRLREVAAVLEFYANPLTYVTAISEDQGEQARQALKALS